MQFPRTLRSAKSTLVLLSFSIAAAVPAARADDASHRAKAEEMLRLTKTDAGLRDQLTNLQTRIAELAKQQFKPAHANGRADGAADRVPPARCSR